MDVHSNRVTGASTAAACDPAGPAPSAVGGNGHSHAKPDPTESFRRVSTLLAEVKEYAAYYLSTKIDGIKLTARNIGIFAVLGILGLIIGSAILSTAAVLLLVGAALGIADLLWDKLWAGALIVSLLVLGGVALAATLGLKMLGRKFKASTVQKYEQRQNWERGQFGRNVSEQATVGAD